MQTNVTKVTTHQTTAMQIANNTYMTDTIMKNTYFSIEVHVFCWFVSRAWSKWVICNHSDTVKSSVKLTSWYFGDIMSKIPCAALTRE